MNKKLELNSTYFTLVRYSSLKSLSLHPSAEFRCRNQHVTESHPTSSGKGFLIPIRQPLRNSDGEGILITFLYKRNFILKNLLRKLIFKGVSVLEWTVIFHLFEKDLKLRSDLENLLVFGMLNLSSSTRMSLDDWHFQTKPLNALNLMTKRTNSLIGKREISLLEGVLEILDIPSRYQDVISHKRVRIPFKSPKESRRVGVGYKDHGSLAPEHKWLPYVRDYSPPQPILFDKIRDLWQAFLQVVRET